MIADRLAAQRPFSSRHRKLSCWLWHGLRSGYYGNEHIWTQDQQHGSHIRSWHKPSSTGTVFTVIPVHADALAPGGARTSAGTGVTEKLDIFSTIFHDSLTIIDFGLDGVIKNDRQCIVGHKRRLWGYCTNPPNEMSGSLHKNELEPKHAVEQAIYWPMKDTLRHTTREHHNANWSEREEKKHKWKCHFGRDFHHWLPGAVILATSGAACDGHFIKMTFPLQWNSKEIWSKKKSTKLLFEIS